MQVEFYEKKGAFNTLAHPPLFCADISILPSVGDYVNIPTADKKPLVFVARVINRFWDFSEEAVVCVIVEAG